MKKFIIILGVFLCLTSFFFFGQEDVFYQNSATLQWDDMTTDANGDPLLADDIVTYQVYIYDLNDTDVTNNQDINQLIYIGETSINEQYIDFPSRKQWVAGVRQKVIDGGGNTEYSDISWSTNPLVVANNPFLYSPLLENLNQPTGLKELGM